MNALSFRFIVQRVLPVVVFITILILIGSLVYAIITGQVDVNRLGENSFL